MEETTYTPVSPLARARAVPAPVAMAVAAGLAVLLLALMALIVMPTPPAHALSGGTGLGDGNNAGNNSGCPGSNLGARELRLGDCGSDVRTVHWLLATRNLTGWGGKLFVDSTETGVRKFQKRKGLNRSGVVNKATVGKFKSSMKRHRVSWYNAWGNRTACGQKLKKKTIGVAVPAKKIKRFPCGTKLVLNYGGRWVRAKVIDTGGFGGKTKWDLTGRTAAKLNANYKVDGLFKVRVAVKPKKKKK